MLAFVLCDFDGRDRRLAWGAATRSPRQNPFAERVIGSAWRECLDNVIALSERHSQALPADRVPRAYSSYGSCAAPDIQLRKRQRPGKNQ